MNINRHPLFKTWAGMRQRCQNERASNFRWYGGRGIKVCARWESFDAFVTDMGPTKPVGSSLDRIDCDGDYEPANCRWASQKEQVTNSRAIRWIEYAGQRHSLTDWARLCGITPPTLWNRLRRYPLETALSPARLRK